MNKVIFKSIKIANFKGISSCELEFDKNENTIKGKNGSGKTSIKNAIEWVLCQNVKDIIPNKNNKELLGLETSVELVLSINDCDYTFKRTRKDTIDKNTGNKKGNDIKYYVDNMEVEAKIYEGKLAILLGNGTMQNVDILIDNEYFNQDTTSWKWSNRRKMLFDICGVDKAIETIVNQDKYEPIKDQVKKGVATSDIKSIINKTIKTLKQSQDKNLGIIEYNMQSIQELESIDFDNVEKEIETLNKELETINGSSNNELQSELLTKISQDLLEKNKELAKLETQSLANQNSLRKLTNELYNEVKDLYVEYEKRQKELQYEKEQIELLEKDFKDTCPMCNQKLPENEIEKQKTHIESEKKEYKEQLEIKQSKLKEVAKLYKEKTNQYNENKAKLDNYEDSKEIIDLRNAIKDLKTSLEVEKNENLSNLSQDRKNEITSKIKALYVELGKKQQLEKLKFENSTKQQENRNWANEIVSQETKMKVLEDFIKEQIDIVNSTINDKFSNGISFALYNETYKNGEGGLEEDCVCMYNKKRYSSLSNGERIIANLEVVKVLQEYFGVNMPIIINNHESLTIPYELNNQTIKLFAEANSEIENIKKI